MKFGLFGDIHANLEALEVVLGELAKEEVGMYICLGDVVGYGANPGECLDRTRELAAITVAGNHDFAIAGKLNIDFFNSYAKQAVLWTREQLRKDQIQWLRDLELVKKHEDVLTVVHGTLNFPEMFDYIQTSYDAHLSLELLETPVCFLGHSHVPVAFFQGPTVSFTMDYDIDIDLNSKTLVNIGSVGQPRDENPKAAYAVYDTDTQKVHIRRVDYDIDKAAKKIIDAGLPEILGERLKYGR
ncbi:MAG: metallophosphoesterase family protein [Planctomycetes bacterium]|nr:metallophosphoesterase family protein [Planctomycetota bacterium]